MVKPTIGVLLSCLLFSSCYSSKKLATKSPYKVQPFNAQVLTGFYTNQIEGEQNYILWKQLKLAYTHDLDSLSTKNLNTVSLEFKDANTLNIKVLDKSKTVSQFTLHGRVEGSYFRVDRNLKLIPFWPIYYTHWEKLVLLGNDSEGNLIVLMHDVGSGAILMMGAGHKLLHTFKAERIKN